MNIEKLKEWMDFAEKCGGPDNWEQPLDVKTGSAGIKRVGKIQFPLVDILQMNTEIMVIAELPGVKKEDLTLSVSGNILHLKGSTRAADITGQPVQLERYAGPFERYIQLPSVAQGSLISANMADGLLTIRFRNVGCAVEKIRLD